MSLPADIDLVDDERKAAAVMDTIAAAEVVHAREHRRPRALSLREALSVLRFEVLFVSVALLNHRNGVPLDDEDEARLLLAANFIDNILAETGAA
jgi:hypothetical protein